MLSIVRAGCGLIVQLVLQEAARNRVTARTNMNERSSRSHSVLTVRLQPADGSAASVLHLVDLAGGRHQALFANWTDGVHAVMAPSICVYMAAGAAFRLRVCMSQVYIVAAM
jgi:Kinesin motor domain